MWRPLYRRLSALGSAKEGSVMETMNGWVKEGRVVTEKEIRRFVRELRKYNRHQHALEVSSTHRFTVSRPKIPSFLLMVSPISASHVIIVDDGGKRKFPDKSASVQCLLINTVVPNFHRLTLTYFSSVDNSNSESAFICSVETSTPIYILWVCINLTSSSKCPLALLPSALLFFKLANLDPLFWLEALYNLLIIRANSHPGRYPEFAYR